MSKLSIIIPVYNSEKYLRRCIDSVTKQDPADCQVILIDDGSTDDSFEIMKEEAEKYNYIDIIHQKNQGVSMARNAGLKKATGEWIYFLDSDDELVSGAVKRILDFTAEKCEWLIFNYYKQIEGTEKRFKNKISAGEMDKYQGKEAFPELLEEQLFMLQCGKVFRRDIIETNQLYFQKNVVYGEDIRFNLKYFQYVDNYVLSDIPVFVYHIRQGTGAGSAYYADAFEMQMDIDKEICYMVDYKYHLSESAKRKLNRYFYFQGINTAAAYWNVWTDVPLKKRIKEIRKIMKDERFVEFLEKEMAYRDINGLDYFLLKHNKYIIYYYVHYVYTLLKRVIAKEKS